MQKARRQAFPLRGIALRQFVGDMVSDLFTPLPGFFSPFPHGTCSLSVAQEYLALSGGPDGFRPDFTCPVLLGILPEGPADSPTGLSPAMAELSRTFGFNGSFQLPAPAAAKAGSPTTPHRKRLQAVTPARFRLFRVRSPLLAESLRVLFLQVLRCFTPLRSLHSPYVFRRGYPCGWVSPFGNPGLLTAGWRLTLAYRSLPRPSSPLSA